MWSFHEAPHVVTREARCRIGRADVDCLDWEQTISRVLDLARGGAGRSYVVTPNIQHVAMLEKDPALEDAYRGAALVLPDGFPVALTASLMLRRRVPRITGADLLPRLCEAAATSGLTIGLVGGSEGAAQAAAEHLRAQHPSLAIALIDSPLMGFDRSPELTAALASRIREADPDLLFVGLGAPKQELFVHGHADSLGSGVALCVGAAIDFAAGTVPRAPMAVQRFGLEWLWRVVHEPRRLVHRYVSAAPVFVRVAARSLLRGPRGRA